MRREKTSSFVHLTISLFVLLNTLCTSVSLNQDNNSVINQRKKHVDDLYLKQFSAADPELKLIDTEEAAVIEEKYLGQEHGLDLPPVDVENNNVELKSSEKQVLYHNVNEDPVAEWITVSGEKRRRVTRQINQGHAPLYPQLPSSQPYGQYPPYSTQPNNPFVQNQYGSHYPTYNYTQRSNPSLNPTYPSAPSQNGQHPPYNSASQRPPYGAPQVPVYGTQYPTYNSSHSSQPSFNPTHHGQYPSYTTSPTTYPAYNPASQTPPYNQYPSYNSSNPTYPSFNPTQRPGGSIPTHNFNPHYNPTNPSGNISTGRYPSSNTTNGFYPHYNPTSSGSGIPTSRYPSSNASHGYYPPYNPTSQRPPYNPSSSQYPTFNPSQQQPGSWQSPSYNNSNYQPYSAHNTPNSNPNYNPSYPSYNPTGQKQPYGQNPSQYPGYDTSHLSYPGHAVGTLPNNYTNSYGRY